VDERDPAGVLLDQLDRVHARDARPERVELEAQQVARGLVEEHVDGTHAVDRLELERVGVIGQAEAGLAARLPGLGRRAPRA
jgi:hypothetical protein